MKTSMIPFVLLTAVTALVAADWPQWRGAQRNAVSLDTELADTWPDDGPPVVWRTKIGASFKNHYGNGPRSTPLVDDAVVFAIGTSGRLAALSAGSGEPLWQHDLVKEFGTKLPSYGYSSSPIEVTIDGVRQVVFWSAHGFQRGSLIAADGKLIVLGESGNLALAEASPEGFVEIDSVKVFAGKLYLRNHEELVCLDVSG